MGAVRRILDISKLLDLINMVNLLFFYNRFTKVYYLFKYLLL
eukprot:UN02242